MRNGPISMLLASTLLWTGTALSQSSESDVHGRLRALADARPAIAHLSSIGTSFSGRDVWLLRIGSGDAHAPALWLDAAHDGRDAVGRETALRVAEHLLTSLPADSLDRLLNGATLFVLPEASPDGRETGLIPRPDDEDGDGLEDEDGPDDIDGDGRVVWMRVPDPAGEWALDPGDARTLVKRKPEDEGPFYRRYREGSDADGDGLVNEDPRGGVSLLHNFPAGWEMPKFQPHAGPYSPSEAETIAILEQLVAHPEIGAVITLGQGDRPEKPGVGTGASPPATKTRTRSSTRT